MFDLDDEVKINQQKQKSNKKCYYDWKPSEKRISYFVNLSFVSGDRRTRSEIDEVWRVQSGFSEKHNPRGVSGVGDKASWSDHHGGNLCVIAKGYIFNIDFSIIPEKNSPLDDQARIDKARDLAKQVIERIQLELKYQENLKKDNLLMVQEIETQHPILTKVLANP